MKRINFLLALLFAFYSGFPISPVNPLATNDVKKVLNYLSDIKGKGILTGQQNLAPDVMKWTNKVAGITGKYPALLGEDFSYHERIILSLAYNITAENENTNKFQIPTKR